MFAESTPLCLYERSIYNEHTFAPPFSFPYLYYTIIYYIRETLFPALTLSRHFLTLIHSFIIYSIYREEYTFPQLLPLSHTSIILLLYIEEETFYPPPFSPYIYSYKVNTFTPPIFLPL